MLYNVCICIVYRSVLSLSGQYIGVYCLDSTIV